MKKTSENLGEKLFYEICEFQGWDSKKIKEKEEKTPDFEVKTTKGQFIAEVKQFEYDYEFGEVLSYTTGNKVRAAIKKAKDQLQGHEFPSLLALLDTRGMGLTGYENILSAMYGALTINVNKVTGEAGPMFHGRDAKMRENWNTSISAVAAISYSGANKQDLKPHIVIYHNMYAKHPFASNFFGKKENLVEYWFEEERVA